MRLKKLGIILLQVILVVLNVLFFMWTEPSMRSSVVWLSYTFVTISYLILEAAILVPRQYQSRTWNWSLIYIAAMLFVAELFLGIVLSSLFDTITLPITIQLVTLLGFMVWGYLHVSASTKTTAALKKQEQEAVYARDLALQVKGLISLVPDNTARKNIKDLYEKIWCSPRASNPRAQECERSIELGIEDLKAFISVAKWDEVSQLAKDLMILADKRNTML